MTPRTYEAGGRGSKDNSFQKENRNNRLLSPYQRDCGRGVDRGTKTLNCRRESLFVKTAQPHYRGRGGQRVMAPCIWGSSGKEGERVRCIFKGVRRIPSGITVSLVEDGITIGNQHYFGYPGSQNLKHVLLVNCCLSCKVNSKCHRSMLRIFKAGGGAKTRPRELRWSRGKKK